jgi:uncharacterized damage-inducible protein DinB
MYTTTSVLDMHERAHRSLKRLIEHCEQLSVGELERELEGFGYPTIRQQLEHVIGAEEYWINVIRSRYTEDGSAEEHPPIAAIEAYRCRVAEATADYLRTSSQQELNGAREMLTWPNKMRMLIPAHVVLRTLTHIYQHQGQVLAMCRMMGRPGPAGLDFPLD